MLIVIHRKITRFSYRKFFITLILLSHTFITKAFGSSELFQFTLLHTNDLHSAFLGEGPHAYFSETLNDKNDTTHGHYSRLSSAIAQVRKYNKEHNVPTLLVDSGDFYAGSLYHILTPNKTFPESPELEFFSYNNYDAVGLGNHEFDADENGFFTLLEKNSKYKVPFVNTNMQMNGCHTSFQKCDPRLAQIDTYFIKDLEQNHQKLRIGFLGILGVNAIKVSTHSRSNIKFVGFDDNDTKEQLDKLSQFIQNKVDSLRKEKKVDVVVLLLHGGTPEDEELAKQLNGVNVIIAGHTHELYKSVKYINKTIIAQTGAFGANLGKLDFEYKDHLLTLKNPNTPYISIDNKIPVDRKYLAIIKSYDPQINRFFARTGFNKDTKIFTLATDLPYELEMNTKLGTFVDSRILAELNKNLSDKTDIYFGGIGAIRNGLQRLNGKPTTYQFSDIFQLVSLGFSEDLFPGYPVESFYLTKKDFLSFLKFTEMYSLIDPLFSTTFSHTVTFDIRHWGIPLFNRIKNPRFYGRKFEDWPNLLKLSGTSHVISYFYKIKPYSHGLVDIVPRDKQGEPLASPLKETTKKEFELLTKNLLGKTITTDNLMEEDLYLSKKNSK